MSLNAALQTSLITSIFCLFGCGPLSPPKPTHPLTRSSAKGYEKQEQEYFRSFFRGKKQEVKELSEELRYWSTFETAPAPSARGSLRYQHDPKARFPRVIDSQREKPLLDPNLFPHTMDHQTLTLLRPHRNRTIMAFLSIDSEGNERLYVQAKRLMRVSTEPVFDAQWAGDSLLYVTPPSSSGQKIYAWDMKSNSSKLIKKEWNPQSQVKLHRSEESPLLILNDSVVETKLSTFHDDKLVTLTTRLDVPFHAFASKDFVTIVTKEEAPRLFRLNNKSKKKTLIATLSRGASFKSFHPGHHVSISFIGDTPKLHRVTKAGMLSITLPKDITDLEFLTSGGADTLSLKLYSATKLPRNAVLPKNSDVLTEVESKEGLLSLQSQTLKVASKDGTLIPLSLTSQDLNSSQPILLTAYGAYGRTLRPRLSGSDIPLLARGFHLATCHVRGGGYHGVAWHQAALKEGKQRSFDDFVACAKHLKQSGLATILFAKARSAGALLVGYSAVKTPSLFDGLIVEAPFLDVLESLRDTMQALSFREHHEWGDPWEHEIQQAMKAYSPFENEPVSPPPPLYLLASKQDKVVSYTEARDWLSKLRRSDTPPPLALFSLFEQGNHQGAYTKDEQLKEEARQILFMLELVS